MKLKPMFTTLFKSGSVRFGFYFYITIFNIKFVQIITLTFLIIIIIIITAACTGATFL